MDTKPTISFKGILLIELLCVIYKVLLLEWIPWWSVFLPITTYVSVKLIVFWFGKE